MILRLAQMKAKYHVVIVGAGFAGLAAADTLAKFDLDILIIDEHVHTGGQLLRKMQTSLHRFTRFDPDRMKILKKIDRVEPRVEKDEYCSKVQRLIALDRRQHDYASFLGGLCRVPV